MRTRMIDRMILCALLLVGLYQAPLWGQVCLGDLPGVNQVEMIGVDGDRLYVLDGTRVHIFSMPELRLVKSFGKEGAGPGEFRTDFMNRLRLMLLPDRVVLSDFRKAALFGRDGQFIREINFPFGASQVIPLNDGLLVTRFVTGERGINQMGVVLLDAELRERKRLHVKPEIDVARSQRLDAPNEMIFLMADEQLYVADMAKMEIKVFTQDGHEVKTLSLDHKPLPISEQYRTEVMQWFEDNWEGRFKGYAQAHGINKEIMQKMIHFPEFFPAFRSVVLTKKGFFIQTYEKKGSKSKFLLIDRNGTLEKELYLTDAEPGWVKMMAGVSFAFGTDGYYYAMEDADQEVWRLYHETF